MSGRDNRASATWSSRVLALTVSVALLNSKFTPRRTMVSPTLQPSRLIGWPGAGGWHGGGGGGGAGAAAGCSTGTTCGGCSGGGVAGGETRPPRGIRRPTLNAASVKYF